MYNKNNIVISNTLIIILFLIYIAFTIYGDISFFNVKNLLLNPIYIITKIIAICIIFVVIHKIKNFFIEYKNGNKSNKIFLFYFLIFFILNVIVAKFILLPDFVSDSEIFATDAKNLHFSTFRLRYFSTLFYIISYEILPIHLSPVWCQIAVVSFLVTSIFKKLYQFFDMKILLMISLPFILPIHLVMNALTYRSVLLAYLVLYLCIILFIKFYKKEFFSKSELLFYSIFPPFLFAIRHETILIGILFPIIFILIFKKQLTRVNKLIFAFLSLLFLAISNIDLHYNIQNYSEQIFSNIRHHNGESQYLQESNLIENYKNLISNTNYFKKQLFKLYRICCPSEFIHMWDGCFNFDKTAKIEHFIRNTFFLKYLNANVFIPLILNSIIFIAGIRKRNSFMIYIPLLIYINFIIVSLFMTGIAYYYHSISTIVPYILCPVIILSYTKYNKLKL